MGIFNSDGQRYCLMTMDVAKARTPYYRTNAKRLDFIPMVNLSNSMHIIEPIPDEELNISFDTGTCCMTTRFTEFFDVFVYLSMQCRSQ